MTADETRSISETHHYPTDVPHVHHSSNARATGVPADFREVPLDNSRMFYMLYQGLDAQIQLADSKANLVLGANAILIATSALDRGVVRTILIDGSSGRFEQLSIAFTLSMLTGLILSVFYALRTSVPNLRRPEEANDPFFFLHIKEMAHDHFIQAFLKLDELQIKKAVLSQIHAKSYVVSRKFHLMRSSMVALFFALIMWVCSQVTLALV